jgi:hypothetical protein
MSPPLRIFRRYRAKSTSTSWPPRALAASRGTPPTAPRCSRSLMASTSTMSSFGPHRMEYWRNSPTHGGSFRDRRHRPGPRSWLERSCSRASQGRGSAARTGRPVDKARHRALGARHSQCVDCHRGPLDHRTASERSVRQLIKQADLRSRRVTPSGPCNSLWISTAIYPLRRGTRGPFGQDPPCRVQRCAAG